MRKLWKLISPSTPADKGSAPTTPRIRSFHPHSHPTDTHTQNGAFYRCPRANTRVVYTWITRNYARQIRWLLSAGGFIAALLNGYGRCDRSWIIYIISPEGDVVKKKMKQTRGRCRYIEMYKGEKGETKMVGRITRIGENDTLKSRETPKPSLLLSAEIFSRPSKCIV